MYLHCTALAINNLCILQYLQQRSPVVRRMYIYIFVRIMLEFERLLLLIAETNHEVTCWIFKMNFIKKNC